MNKVIFKCSNCEWESDPAELQNWMYSIGNICPQCGEIVSSHYINEIHFTPDFDMSWDKGAYIASKEPKLRKPISPPDPEEEEAEEEDTVSATHFVCRNCIYCMRAEFPVFNEIVLQWICKKYPVKGELIYQEPLPEDEELADSLIDIDINWCGKGEWIIGDQTVGAEDVANKIREKQ